MVSTQDTHADTYSARYSHRFLRTGPNGQMVNFPALDRWIAEVADQVIAGLFRDLAEDYHAQAEDIAALAGPGSHTAALYRELAEELSRRVGGQVCAPEIAHLLRGGGR